MVARKHTATLTLFCLVVALGLATVTEANSLVHHPRDHVGLNRMIKKRSPDGVLASIIPIVGAEGNQDTSTSATSASSTGIGSATSSPADSATSTGTSTDTGASAAPTSSSSTVSIGTCLASNDKSAYLRS